VFLLKPRKETGMTMSADASFVIAAPLRGAADRSARSNPPVKSPCRLLDSSNGSILCGSSRKFWSLGENIMNNGFGGTRKGSAHGSGNGRLVGWLVSYGLDAKGASFEIRSGRSFVTSESSTDGLRMIAVEDSSISAPHLALSATPKHRVMVQDIFSETGSYLCRSGDRDEKRIDGPTEVSHGDWLRVGENTRFQVCLIDGPGK
jgi:hypothetical protein